MATREPAQPRSGRLSMASSYYNAEDLGNSAISAKGPPEPRREVLRLVRRGVRRRRADARARSRSSRSPSPTPCSAPTASTPTRKDALEKGSDLEQMTEAVHVAAAIRGGASLVHGVQMPSTCGTKGSRCERRSGAAERPRDPGRGPKATRILRAAAPARFDGGPARSSTRCRSRGDSRRARGAAGPRSRPAHRGLPGQRRQAVQPDLPPLPRRRRARPRARYDRARRSSSASRRSPRRPPRPSTSPAARPS